MTEAKALRCLQAGSEEAMEWFIDRYSGYVATVVYNITGGSREDLEELCSDVFFALWNSAGKLRGGNVKAWLASTARHKSIDFLRKTGREIVPEDDVLELPGPAEALDKAQERDAVHRAVLAMVQPDREIFLRYYYSSQKISTIAQALSMPESTVKTHLRRGREKLRAVLMEELE